MAELQQKVEALQADLKAAWNTNRAIDNARMEDRARFEEDARIAHAACSCEACWFTEGKDVTDPAGGLLDTIEPAFVVVGKSGQRHYGCSPREAFLKFHRSEIAP